MGSVLVLLSAAAARASGLPARASGLPDRVAVTAFSGPQSGRMLRAVETSLMARYYLVPNFTVEDTARRRGVTLLTDADFGVVGRALDVRGFVSAEVERRDGWRVRLAVRHGETGAEVGGFVMVDRRLDRLETRLLRQAPGRVQALLARAGGGPSPIAPPALADRRAPADEAIEASSADEAADASEPPLADAATTTAGAMAGGAPRLVAVSLEGRLFTRSFSYVQNLSGLPDYRLGRAFATALDLALHPGALLAPELAPLAVVAALEQGLGVGSREAGSDQRFSSDVRAYRVGAGWRLAGADAELTPAVAYAVHGFAMGKAEAPAPDVRYRLVWAGADGRWSPLPRATLLATAAYLHALSAGPMTGEERFPRAIASGVALAVGGAYGVTDALELRATVGLRRMGFDMKAEPGDRLVAGGAIDQSVWAGLALAYRAPAARGK
jgi:hypothetical protein